MRRLNLLWLLIVAAATAYGQNVAFNGFCVKGGISAVVQGLNSTNKLQGIIPSCKVEVFLTGTTTHATIYADSVGTPLSNPFTADALSAAAPGKWLFFAATGQGYDVTLSGGIPPNAYSLPVTLTDLIVGGGGGGTGVTNFSAGNLNPLFNTAVSNPGTTPNLSFTQQNAAANTIFGNFTGTSGPPFFATFTCTGLLSCTYDGTTNVWNVNIPSTSTLSITATSPIRVNGGAGPVSSGTANIDCPTCGTPQIQMNVVPPASGNYVVLYPSTQDFATGSSGYCAGWNAANPSGGYGVSFPNYSGLFTGGVCKNTLSGWVDENGNPWPMTGYNPANVTAVYAVSVSSYQAGTYTPPYSGQAFNGAASMSCSGSSILNNTPVAQQKNALTSLTGATIAASTCVESITQSSSILTAASSATISAPTVALYVYTSDAPTPSSTALNIGQYLTYDRTKNLLTTDQTFPHWLFAQSVGDLFTTPSGLQ